MMSSQEVLNVIEQWKKKINISGSNQTEETVEVHNNAENRASKNKENIISNKNSSIKSTQFDEKIESKISEKHRLANIFEHSPNIVFGMEHSNNNAPFYNSRRSYPNDFVTSNFDVGSKHEREVDRLAELFANSPTSEERVASHCHKKVSPVSPSDFKNGVELNKRNQDLLKINDNQVFTTKSTAVQTDLSCFDSRFSVEDISICGSSRLWDSPLPINEAPSNKVTIFSSPVTYHNFHSDQISREVTPEIKHNMYKEELRKQILEKRRLDLERMERERKEEEKIERRYREQCENMRKRDISDPQRMQILRKHDISSVVNAVEKRRIELERMEKEKKDEGKIYTREQSENFRIREVEEPQRMVLGHRDMSTAYNAAYSKPSKNLLSNPTKKEFKSFDSSIHSVKRNEKMIPTNYMNTKMLNSRLDNLSVNNIKGQKRTPLINNTKEPIKSQRLNERKNKFKEIDPLFGVDLLADEII